MIQEIDITPTESDLQIRDGGRLRNTREDGEGNGSITLSAEFIASVVSRERVSGCPHDIYKYPARFSPGFARRAIEEYSREGDVVLDCFSGGGTSLVEGLASGRRVVGADISSLACFLASAKTAPLSIHDERLLNRWIARVTWQPGIWRFNTSQLWDAEEGYYWRNLPGHVIAVLSFLLAEIRLLPTLRQQRFARLILLSVGQAALDCKKKLPTVGAVHREYCERFVAHLAAFREFTWGISHRNQIQHLALRRSCRIINTKSEGISEHPRFPHEWGKATLVVTSPPYPGVHMLYHRWQLLGRRETPAPFFLANCRDGSGVAHYCLGGRHRKGLATYFDRIEEIFRGVKTLLRNEAVVIQIVAFNRPESQLRAYLAAMAAAGYSEIQAADTSEYIVNGRLWRPVPGRKWYAAMRNGIPAANEVVLIHKPDYNATCLPSLL